MQDGDGASRASGDYPDCGSNRASASGRLPLARDDNTDYEILRTRLKPGDLLMMTTDGLAKSRQGKQFLGLDGVATITRASRNAGTLQDIGQSVLRAAEEYVGGTLENASACYWPDARSWRAYWCRNSAECFGGALNGLPKFRSNFSFSKFM